MNLFFRLVRIFLAALFSKKDGGITDLYKLKFSVWLTDQDMFAHMTNSRYFSFSDLGTINFIIRSNCWGTMRKRGWIPVILSEKVIVGKMLKFPQAFELETQITCWDDTYVAIQHKFVRKGRTHATVELVAKFAATDRSFVNPEMVLKAVGHDVTSPPLTKTFIELRDDIIAARQKNKNST
ncbi:thioesterase family protein [Hyphomonas sp. FCG-A18]|uniref:thioesterase family protein n=1 Tax=Hyphomonas sp. FCG-A18 TaxID=3080019 RepID=UPI002B29A189|nr:thioesterase family protein [Hyphomonas sp. FCG-A18]